MQLHLYLPKDATNVEHLSSTFRSPVVWLTDQRPANLTDKF